MKTSNPVIEELVEELVKKLKAGFSACSQSAGLLLVAFVLLCSSSWVMPQAAQAYPFWAQENYETPREATGKIVCANCHLAEKKTILEVPQAVLPDSVFKATVKIPYDLDSQQVLGDGSKGGLNVGAVLMLPDGFTLAPQDRIPEEIKEEVGSTYFQEYSDEHPNWVIVGPLPGEQYQEIVFPVLSPDPAANKNVHFGKSLVFVGGNRGRGQVYPTGLASNNNVYNAPATGTISAIEKTDAGGYTVTIAKEDGTTATEEIQVGVDLLVNQGDAVEAGMPLTNNPNVGGFGQTEKEIVLQSPNRIKGLVAFLAAISLSQILLALKKKQVERVQAAEMSF
ncbi:MAG: cytochrome b6-F complex cytochrome c subunit PetA [Phormidesmis priestleyi Ana]|uniref:Cytochrome f n=1 Tax=Phormidesmis priestleyi Ana TaxID=1666911 RepID=A0A0P8A2U3_9CYAN|nr:MAG: cytochrome b6-F complex cytochrome c subunit PetA [Phormidesmis priestleyi Ana]